MATSICARCGADNEGQPLACAACGEDPLVAGRYALRAVIGRGSGGVTWAATRHPDGLRVCLKELRWDRMGSLEDEERFRREAALLRTLDHPGIPRYLDELAWPPEPGPRHALWLVQELVDGPSLEVERTRRRYRVDEILTIGREVAAVLDHLATCRPPVVHRDLKPGNLVRRPDGGIALVDFGAARAAGLRELGRASVAGTFGTMAPEQLRGEATPASDVYGLAMTLASLLAGVAPEELLDDHNRPALERIEGLPDGLRALLEDMLSPVPTARPSAREVATRLAGLRAGGRARAPRRAVEVAARAGRVATRGPRILSLVVVFGILGVALAIALSVLGTVNRALDAALPPTPTAPPAPTTRAAPTPRPAAPTPAPEPPPPAAPEPTPAEREAARRAELTDAGARCGAGTHAGCEALWRAWLGAERELVVALGLAKTLEAGCAAGDAEACAWRGTVSIEGAGVPASVGDGRAWYVRACDAGHVETCARSGRMLVDGEGGRVDAQLGVAQLQKACDAGDEVACMNIGVALARGQGIPAERDKALAIFERACRGGQSLACQNLDGLVGNDWGLPRDARERMSTLVRLCDLKIGTACARAGDAARAGRGTPKDAAAAVDYWRRACNLGIDAACQKAR